MDKPLAVILHISNLLMHDSPLTASAEKWFAELAADLATLRAEARDYPTYLVVSGNITRSGHPSEFSAAARVLGQMIGAAEIEPRNVIAVPGPHDYDVPLQSRRSDGLRSFRNFVHSLRIQDGDLFDPRLYYDAELAFIPIERTGVDTNGQASLKNMLARLLSELSDSDAAKMARVVVTHRGVDPHVSPDQSLAEFSLLEAFLQRLPVDLILHAGEHGPTVLKTTYGLHVGGGTIASERLRSPRQYQVIRRVGDRRWEVLNRIYQEQAARWISDADAQGAVRFLTSGSEINADEIDASAATLTHSELRMLFDTLRPDMPGFDAVDESKAAFMSRLVDHFSKANSLGSLQRSIRRIVGARVEATTRIWLLGSHRDVREIRMMAESLSQLGFKATSGETVDELLRSEAEQRIDMPDVFLFCISPAAFLPASMNAINNALSYATREAIPVAIIDLGTSDLPEPLRHLPVVRAQPTDVGELARLIHGILDQPAA